MQRRMSDDFIVSDHALMRAQQRGLRLQAIELVLQVRDRTQPIGEGLQAWSVSRARQQRLRDAGLPSSVIERAGRTILVVDPLRRVIKTVINGHPDTHRRYRHGHRGHWASQRNGPPAGG